MSALLIVLLILLYTLQSFFCKIYTDSYPGREDLASPVFTAVSGLCIALISFAFSGFHFDAQWQTILLGVINAAALFCYNRSLISASQNGPYSVQMVFMIAGGILIPTFAASVFFDDHVSVIKYICIAVVLLSVYLISRKEGDFYRNKKRFFISATVLGIANGVYGSLLDAQQRLTGDSEKEELLCLTYALACLISFAQLLLKERRKIPAALRQTPRSAIFLMMGSVVTALAANLMVYILQLVNVTVLYTLDNSCVFLISVLFSCIFFKEKLTKMNLFGCAAMCAALVCITEFWKSL